MIRKTLSLLSMVTLLAAAFPAAAQQDRMYYAAHHNYRVVDVVDGLVQPWSMAWLPNGDMLVTEKPGRLRIVRNGRLLPEAVPGVPDVLYDGQGGLFDVVPHPDFASNKQLYLSFAKDTSSSSTTAIVRATFENDRLTNVTEIFAAEADGNGHYGGKIVLDGNGYLFLSLGDRQAPPRGDLESHPAQDRSNHHGVIVRLHEDGRIPADNPFVDEPDVLPEIWSYGHRSPQGLAIHPATGDLWESEHGPQGGDEINLIQPGNNYGWPVNGFGVNYVSGAPIHAATTSTSSERPAHVWVPSIATSGLAIYSGDKFPMWEGSILSGGLAGEQLARLQLTEDNKEILIEETLAYGLGRIRDVRVSPDGYIYIAISDRTGGETQIARLEPAN